MGAETTPWPLGNGPTCIPLAVKIAFTVYMAVLIPVYWNSWGPLNFLWFCDVCMILTTVALWLEIPLLLSMLAVAIVVPQLLWAGDFASRLILGKHFFFNISSYMFNDEQPLFVRGLSTFHGWLPFLLLWMLWCVGYDRRALGAQTLLAWAVLGLTFLLVTTNDPLKAGNVNYIFGLNDKEPQTWMPPACWLGVLMLLYPVCIYVPSHFLLRSVFSAPMSRV
jgi:hypothetical protein